MSNVVLKQFRFAVVPRAYRDVVGCMPIAPTTMTTRRI